MGGAVTLVRAQTPDDNDFWEEFRVEWGMLILEGGGFPHVGDEGLGR